MNSLTLNTQYPIPNTHSSLNSCRLGLLMHENLTGKFGKMGLGLLRYSDASIPAVIDRQHAGKNARDVTGIPRSVPIVATVEEAVALGVDTLVPGIAPAGGVLPSDWWADVKMGLSEGLSLVNGLHKRMETDPELLALLHPGRFIWDVRVEPENLSNGTGAARTLPCKRVLTVGTDMAIGKMTASLEMDRAAKRRGLRSKFLATGQIGICIIGDRTNASGVALDAVRVDFASGVVEAMVMRHGNDYDLLNVEGQGSILHPASTAWLPLIRGACPTHMILVHRAGQQSLSRHPDIAIPPLPVVCQLYAVVCTAGGIQPPAQVVGIALNCGHLNEEEARREVEKVEAETGLPTADVVRDGADKLLEAIKA